MTNVNTSSKNKPFLLKPVGKDYIWGGSRLNDDFAKGIDMKPLAETWECSTHQDGQSTVSTGEHVGMTLGEVLKTHKEYLGTHLEDVEEFPILIKLIDAKKDLSVQVHPDDEYAKVHENGSLGKTEMWYVLDAAKDASLVYGFMRDVTKDELRDGLANNTFEKYLQKIKVEKDDVFLIKAGTVHAIGAGTLVAEIQENSNITYRMYDYNRVDKNGKTRELHIEKALDVAKLQSSASPRQPMRTLHYKSGCALELLCRCKYFQVERMLLNTEIIRKKVPFSTDESTFQVLLCISGCGVITDEDGDFIEFFKGDTVFVPANSQELRIHGKAQMLKIGC